MKYLKECSYNNYLAWQKSKTSKPSIRKAQTHPRKWKAIVHAFKWRIYRIGLSKGSTILCSGARFGQESLAAKMLGLVATAFDLVPYPEQNVEQGDFHNLKYECNSFDCYFSTSIDHSNNIPKFISEAHRVLKPNGLMVIGLWDNRPGDYEAVAFNSPYELSDIIKSNGEWKLVSIEVLPKDGKLFAKGKEYQIIFRRV